MRIDDVKKTFLRENLVFGFPNGYARSFSYLTDQRVAIQYGIGWREVHSSSLVVFLVVSSVLFYNPPAPEQKAYCSLFI